jgi:hypothetical protein
MNTQPTPEDKQIMNDILIQLEQKQKKEFILAIDFFYRSK